MAATAISPPPPPSLLPLPSSFSPHHSSQIHARLLRLNLTSHSPPSSLLHFHNSLLQSLTSLSLHSHSLSLLPFGLPLNHFSYPFALKSSTHLPSLSLGRQLHAHLTKSDHLPNPFCASALLDLYVKIGPLDDALKLFDRMPHRTVASFNSVVCGLVGNGLVEKGMEMLSLMERLNLDVEASSWNSVVAGAVQLGDVEMALRVFGEMMAGPVRPNVASFNTVMKVVPDIKRLDWLKELHGFAVRILVGIIAETNGGSVYEDRFWSAVAAGYANNGEMDRALRLFERVRVRNSLLGNSMISGFLNCGLSDKAFDAFREMAADCIWRGMILSKVCMTLLLPECGKTGKAGLEMHGYAVRRGLESDTSVGNALMAMYSRRGDKESVEKVFERIFDRDVVSWNTIVASYAMTHEFDCAFELFQRMIDEGLKPDEYSFGSVLSGCGYSSRLRQGMALHGHIVKSGFSDSYPVVQNSLMDAYGKCGCVDDARRVFNEMEWSDAISWNTIISCYAFSANPREAISLFNKMIGEGWRPNRITFIALLSACSHAGLLDEGLQYLKTMENEHGILPDVDHYTCIVDNMGRLGQLERACQFIKDLPIVPDDCIWSAFLSSCRVHGNIELAEVAAKSLIELEPQHSGYWVLLSNVYADALRWKDVRSVRAAMKDGGVKKSPGYSWIEAGSSEVHRFFNADKLHNKCDDIYLALNGLTDQLKDEGYVPAFEA